MLQGGQAQLIGFIEDALCLMRALDNIVSSGSGSMRNAESMTFRFQLIQVHIGQGHAAVAAASSLLVHFAREGRNSELVTRCKPKLCRY